MMPRAEAMYASIVLLWLGGCYVPIGSIPKPASESQDRAGRAARAAPNQTGNTSVPSGERLVIRGEIIQTEDLWREHREALLTQAKAVPAGEFRRLVAERAFRWINDKISGALLFHSASLLVSAEIERRIDQFVDGDIRRLVTTEFDGVQRRYERHLQSQGLTLEGERARRRREIIVGSFLESEIKPKLVAPTRAESIAVFEVNRNAWRRPSRRRMSLIDVRLTELLGENVTSPSREAQQAAHERTRSIVETAAREISSGLPFAEVARRHSHGLHASEGGSWGWVSPGSVRERFQPAVDELYKLKEGEVSEPIETPDGFLLVRCDEVDPGFEPTFEAVQPELQEQHRRIAYDQFVGELVARLRREAGIDPVIVERFHAATVDATVRKTLDYSPQRD